MSRLQAAFAQLKRDGRGGLIPYLTAADPDPDTTVELIVALAGAGATAIEVGVPFSDPIADGPVIQRACQRALRHNLGVGGVLALIERARARTEAPIVLFSYFNPLLRFGLERLALEARRCGVDGLLVTDLPVEEARGLAESLAAQHLDRIFLVAPTSTEARLRATVQCASGFIYAVSRAGVTGVQEQVSDEARQLASRVRALTDLPLAVGFGIATAQHVADVWQFADAAVVGSALVAEVERRAGDADVAKYAAEFLRSLRPQH